MSTEELIKALREKPSRDNRWLIDEAAAQLERQAVENERQKERANRAYDNLKAVLEERAENKTLLDLLSRQAREVVMLEYTLDGVMHSVDKWLDGDELKQDEVNRAITMREKTLQIVEGLQAEIERLKAQNDILSKNADTAFQDGLNEAQQLYADQIKIELKAKAVKEFAERLKAEVDGWYYDLTDFGDTIDALADIDNLVKELTEGSDNDGGS